jgi:hypothetical protein
MKSLFRNSFFRMVQDRWHWAAIWTALAWGVGGVEGVRYAMYANALVAGLLVSVIFMASLKAMKGNAEADYEREKGKYKFLCPNCLHFGAFLHECGSCKAVVEKFQMVTKGDFNPTCVECQTIIFPGKINASCDKCLRPSNPELHHHRKVEILVTLTTEDFQKLLKASGAKFQHSHRKIDFFFCDENPDLKYVLNFTTFTPDLAIEPEDAWKWINNLWLDLNESDPLQVARQLDALLRINKSDETGRINIFVRQEQIDPVLRLRLEQQFGQIHYAVTPEELFLGAGITALPEAVEGSIIKPAVDPNVTQLPQEARS